MTEARDNVVPLPAAANRLGQLQPNEAKLNVTYGGQNGDFADPVAFNAPIDQVRQWVTEALRSGTIPGIPADPNASMLIRLTHPTATGGR
jgi:hypothetical protein